MSDNVMATYTTISTEPRHYVQYDQGEDRWLCTLILQEGYRVDYSAASDAFTHAPEEFDEFYNQRRRWVPSTTANIMDLLTSFRRTVSKNPDISYWYIAYQVIHPSFKSRECPTHSKFVFYFPVFVNVWNFNGSGNNFLDVGRCHECRLWSQ